MCLLSWVSMLSEILKVHERIFDVNSCQDWWLALFTLVVLGRFSRFSANEDGLGQFKQYNLSWPWSWPDWMWSNFSAISLHLQFNWASSVKILNCTLWTGEYLVVFCIMKIYIMLPHVQTSVGINQPVNTGQNMLAELYMKTWVLTFVICLD